MAKRVLLAPAFSIVLMVYSGYALAADQERAQENMQTQQQVTGRELMTEQERAEHHARMQAATTQEERQQIRMKQHELMKQRAKERGLSIPDNPPAKTQRTGKHKGHNGGGKDH